MQKVRFQDHPAQRDPDARLPAPLLLLVFRHDAADRYEKELLGAGGAEAIGAPLLRADLVHAPQNKVRHGEKGRPLHALQQGRARRGLLRNGPRQRGPRQDRKGAQGERRQVQTGKGEPKTDQGTGNGRIESRATLQEVQAQTEQKSRLHKDGTIGRPPQGDHQQAGGKGDRRKIIGHDRRGQQLQRPQGKPYRT